MTDYEISEARIDLETTPRDELINLVKQLQSRLSIANAEAQSGIVARNEFAANISHEIRTPLNIIAGYSELLQGTALDAQQDKHVERIRAATMELADYVDDLLEIATDEHVAYVANTREEVSVFPMIARIVESLCAECADQPAYADYVDIVPTANVPASIMIDSRSFRRVARKLITNAIHHTPGGGVHISIDVDSPADQQPFLVITVKDDGCGIDPEKCEDLFGCVVDEVGTMSGLSYCAKIAEAMGGRIELLNNEGGATFELRVPFEPIATPTSSEQMKCVCKCESFASNSVVIVPGRKGYTDTLKAKLDYLGCFPHIADPKDYSTLSNVDVLILYDGLDRRDEYADLIWAAKPSILISMEPLRRLIECEKALPGSGFSYLIPERLSIERLSNLLEASPEQ